MKLTTILISLFYCLPLFPTEIFVLRHGQAEHNILRVMSSLAEVSLTEKGIQQVEKSADALSQKTTIDVVFCSPLKRTRQTAAIAAKATNYPLNSIIIDERLREQYFGSFEGKPYLDYIAQFTNKDDEFILGAPDGESGKELYTRVSAFLDEILANPSYKNKNILIVTHAHLLCQISKYLTGSYAELPVTGEWKHFSY